MNFETDCRIPRTAIAKSVSRNHHHRLPCDIRTTPPPHDLVSHEQPHARLEIGEERERRSAAGVRPKRKKKKKKEEEKEKGWGFVTSVREATAEEESGGDCTGECPRPPAPVVR